MSIPRNLLFGAVVIAGLALLLRDRSQIRALNEEVAKLQQVHKNGTPERAASAEPNKGALPSALSTGQEIDRSTSKSIRQAALESDLEKWLDRVSLLKTRIEQTPEWKIPELNVVTNENWLFAVYNNPLQTEKDYERAYGFLTSGAQTRINSAVVAANREFQETHGRPPTQISELIYLLPSTMDEGILRNIEVTPTGSTRRVAPTRP